MKSAQELREIMGPIREKKLELEIDRIRKIVDGQILHAASNGKSEAVVRVDMDYGEAPFAPLKEELTRLGYVFDVVDKHEGDGKFYALIIVSWKEAPFILVPASSDIQAQSEWEPSVLSVMFGIVMLLCLLRLLVHFV